MMQAVSNQSSQTNTHLLQLLLHPGSQSLTGRTQAHCGPWFAYSPCLGHTAGRALCWLSAAARQCLWLELSAAVPWLLQRPDSVAAAAALQGACCLQQHLRIVTAQQQHVPLPAEPLLGGWQLSTDQDRCCCCLSSESSAPVAGLVDGASLQDMAHGTSL